MNNFINDYYAFTSDLESPDSYIYWTCYGVLAAIMRDQYWWADDNDKRKIYPNMYIVLYAKSASTRKGPPLNIAQSLIREVGNTKFLGGRFSIQAAIQIMSEVWTNKNMKQVRGASCCMYSEELIAMLAEDKAVIGLLTDLYDFHEVWENNIKANEGVEKLEHVCITLIAGSNSKLFNDFFNTSAIYGGLLRRFFLIVENKKRKSSSGMYVEPVDVSLRAKLVDHLKKIANNRGQIVFTEDAKEEFDAWYHRLEASYEYDDYGVVAALHTSATKLAMILAAAEYDFRMVVTKNHIERAIDTVSALVKNYKIVVSNSNNTNTRIEPNQEILSVLSEQPSYRIGKKALMRRLTSVMYNPLVFDKSIEWLLNSGYIVVFQVNGEATYELNQELQEKFNKMRERV